MFCPGLRPGVFYDARLSGNLRSFPAPAARSDASRRARVNLRLLMNGGADAPDHSTHVLTMSRARVQDSARCEGSHHSGYADFPCRDDGACGGSVRDFGPAATDQRLSASAGRAQRGARGRQSPTPAGSSLEQALKHNGPKDPPAHIHECPRPARAVRYRDWLRRRSIRLRKRATGAIGGKTTLQRL